MAPKSRRTVMVGAAFVAVLCAVSIVPKLALDRREPRRGTWWRRMQALVNATAGLPHVHVGRQESLLQVSRKETGGAPGGRGGGIAKGGGGSLAGDTASSSSGDGFTLSARSGLNGSSDGGRPAGERQHEREDEGGGIVAAERGSTAATNGSSESIRVRASVQTPANETAEGAWPSPGLDTAGRSARKRGAAFRYETNPSIPLCNVPDASLVPNAWPSAPRGGRPAADWCEFWSTPRTNATFSLLMRGRMANGMLQYLWCRIKADSNGWGMQPINQKTFAGTPWVSPVRHYRNSIFGRDPSAPLAKVNLAGCGPHFQKYAFFKDERCLAQCLFAPRPAANLSHKIFVELGPKDVVIHYREPVELINPVLNVQHQAWNRTIPPWSYYDTILSRLRHRGELGKIWIALAFDMTGMPTEMKQENLIPWQILDTFGGEVIYGTSEQDHYIARNAPIFIGSFGTYSWTIAYLSAGREIHLPYDSAEKAGSSVLEPLHLTSCQSREFALRCRRRPSVQEARILLTLSSELLCPQWNRWSHLFIHDDPRIFYHDCFGEARFQSSSEVAQTATKFGWALRRRSRETGSCNPRLVDPPELRYWPNESSFL